MKNIVLSVVLYALILPLASPAQEYSYSHYGTSEGLAGSTAYCMAQDKEGFIWIGTEAGLSRFDGTHFRTFTIHDGLPDLEILQMFTDSKGRVWMAPFSKSVCYYYQGKIHNEQNDSLIKRIHLKAIIEGFAEDAHGNIAMHERTALHIVGSDGSVVQLDSFDHTPLINCVAISISSSGNFLVQVSKKIIEFSGRRCIRSIPFSLEFPGPNIVLLRPDKIVWKGLETFNILSFSKNNITRLPIDQLHYQHISFSMFDDSLLYINQMSGCIEYNINTGQTRNYLPGIPASRVFRDVQGNLWFTTKGEGIFRLNLNEWKTISLTVEHDEKSMVTAITRIGNELWVGDNHGYLFRYALPDLTLKERKPFFYYVSSRILTIDSAGNNKLITGGDAGFIEGTRDFHYVRQNITAAVKSAVRINDHQLLIATTWGAGIIDQESLRVTDTLWRERATLAFYKKDTFYIGTQSGLYRMIKGQSPVFLGKETPFLGRRISAITESSDGTLWIGSYDNGVIGYKNNKQVYALDRQHGLTSDICRALLVHNNILWIGTDKGLNKIDLSKPGLRAIQYTSRDGLPSEMVNTLFADSSRLYVGTTAGLSFFDQKQIINSEDCRLYIISLVNSDHERIADTTNLIIPYTDKHVRFEFAAISYQSAGNITYKYRLAGLDDKWRETKESFVEYPELPSGNYEWQLMAINRFGKQSRVITVPVTVTIQFWKKTWFVITAWLLSLILLWWMGRLRIVRNRRRQTEKEALMQKMSDLESTALKSQMNPHFIFNCLNSIQHFIFTGDIAASNKYIAGLGKLIRTTLNNSSKPFVHLNDEAAYLSSYLLLEKMRFGEKINYALDIDSSIDPLQVLIPPMLVQPFVENAIKHGLENKTDSKGFVHIKMQKESDMLVITVEDNGIGRKASAAEKTKKPVAFPSKGMSLTEDRINIMNKLYKGTTSVTIIDLNDNTDGTTGTRVVIKMPLFEDQVLYS
jgi:hypothetical protein